MSKRSQKASGTVSLPNAHRQVHPRAHGVAIYYYAWRGGPQIGAFRGATLGEAEDAVTAGAVALAGAYFDAYDRKPAVGLFGRVLCLYRAHPDYTGLKKDTRRTWGVWLDRIYDHFGAMSPDEITQDVFGSWREGVFEQRGARAADHALSVMSRVCSWGREPERDVSIRFAQTFRPTEGFKKRYKAPPQSPWIDTEIKAIDDLRAEVRHALELALFTGLRRADLVRITWTAINWKAGAIYWVTSKGERKGRRIKIPLTPGLRRVLAGIPKRAVQILTNSYGRPWGSPGSLGGTINRALGDSIGGRLHGLRRNAATNLSLEGLSSREMARILGWSEADAEAMGAVYVSEEAAT